jgi:hypothetical protein
MEAGNCYCDASLNQCVGCDPKTEVCDNYECILQVERCDETCDTFPLGDTGNHYFFESRCQVDRPYRWFSNTTFTCSDEGGKFCYCYFKCTPYVKGPGDYQCPQTNPFCAFGYDHRIGTTPYLLPFRNTGDEDREEFKIPAQSSEYTDVNIVVNPGSGFDLYVKIGEACPSPSNKNYDCKGSDVDGKKVCTIDIPSGTPIRIAVYNVSATSSYNISVEHQDLTLEKVTGVELIMPTTTTTTTTTPAWQQVQLGILEFLRRLFSRL